MLKKLVKYGNSTALIIDRAILELLNISEGAVVKLHTDGTSLIITPEKTTTTQSISMGGIEMIQNSLQEQVHQQEKLLQADSIKSKQLLEWMPGTENHIKLQEAYKSIMEKYRDEISKLSSDEFFKAVDILAEKYSGDRTSKGFMQDLLALRQEYSPNLVNMNKEMVEVAKQMGMPDFSTEV